MSFIAAGVTAAGAIAGGVGSYLAGREQSKAIGRAEEAQLEGQKLAIEEQRRQFDAFQKVLQPFVQAGGGALSEMQNLLGIGSPERKMLIDGRTPTNEERRQYAAEKMGSFGARTSFDDRISYETITPEQKQAAALSGIQESPQFQAQLQQGEEAILRQQAATGGLRGGRTQEAIAQFSPNLLNQMIQQRYSQLAGLSQMGQASAAGVGSAGLQTGQQISGILQSGGDAAGQAALARGQISAQTGIGGILGGLGGIGTQLGTYSLGKKLF